MTAAARCGVGLVVALVLVALHAGLAIAAGLAVCAVAVGARLVLRDCMDARQVGLLVAGRASRRRGDAVGAVRAVAAVASDRLVRTGGAVLMARVARGFSSKRRG